MKIETYLHQLWLILIVLLLFVGLFMPIGLFANSEGATAELTNFRMNFIEGDSIPGMWGLAVIEILALIVAIFELLLSGFRNFVLQKRLLVFLSLLMVGYLILFVGYLLLAKGDATFSPCLATAFPVVVLILTYMAIGGVQRAEASIIAKASGFRLRD